MNNEPVRADIVSNVLQDIMSKVSKQANYFTIADFNNTHKYIYEKVGNNIFILGLLLERKFERDMKDGL